MRTSYFFHRSWESLASVALMAGLAMGAPVARVAMVEEEVFFDDAEAGVGNWDRFDGDPDGPVGKKLEYWGTSAHQAIGGVQSFYSSRCNQPPAGPEVCANGAGYVYATHMQAQMILKDAMAFDLSAYDHGVFSYDWSGQTNDPDDVDDRLQHWYNALPTVSPVLQNGAGAVAWQVPNTVTKVGFTFLSNEDDQRGHGAFVDNIRVVGADEKDDMTVTIVNDPNMEFDGTGSDSDVSGAPITDYQWSFGDGQFGSGALARHTYADLGTYQVQLQVTDADGGQDTAVIFVEIVPEPATLGLLLLSGLALLRRRAF